MLRGFAREAKDLRSATQGALDARPHRLDDVTGTDAAARVLMTGLEVSRRTGARGSVGAVSDGK